LVASAAVAVLVRTVIATLVVHQIVASFGAYVSFVRAFVALIVGGVLGELITVAVLFAFLRGSQVAFDVLVVQAMPLIGLAVSVAILASPGHVGTTRGAMEGYHVPPDAPRDWIGEGLQSYVAVSADAGGSATVTAVGDTRVFSKRLPPGRYTITSWLRPCDSNCGTLDDPTDRCQVAISLGRNRFTPYVVLLNPGHSCRIEPIAHG
jgi:hypothetical protein